MKPARERTLKFFFFCKQVGSAITDSSPAFYLPGFLSLAFSAHINRWHLLSCSNPRHLRGNLPASSPIFSSLAHKARVLGFLVMRLIQKSPKSGSCSLRGRPKLVSGPDLKCSVSDLLKGHSLEVGATLGSPRPEGQTLHLRPRQVVLPHLALLPPGQYLQSFGEKSVRFNTFPLSTRENSS